jgi:hypothetical protein
MIILALAAGSASAATIDIDGRLANSTASSALEFGNNSGLADLGVIPAVSVNDSTVALDLSTNGQRWQITYSSGTYDNGEEWNIRQEGGLNPATTNTAAFTNGTYLEIGLDSTAFGSTSFDWTSLSVSLWRNGTAAPNNFQLAFDTDNNGWDTGDLLGTIVVVGSGITEATTITYNTTNLVSAATSGTARLYYWDTTGENNPNGNFHLYDVSADYTAVPEPSSTALLGLGGLALILRRRK